MPLKPLKTKDRLNAVKMNAVAAYSYCRDVLERRWPEAEPYILKNAWYSVFYARDIMKAPWPAAEPEIMKHAAEAHMLLGVDNMVPHYNKKLKKYDK